MPTIAQATSTTTVPWMTCSASATRPSSARPTTRRRSAGRAAGDSRCGPPGSWRLGTRGRPARRRWRRGRPAVRLRCAGASELAGRVAGLGSAAPSSASPGAACAAAPAAVLLELDAVGRVPLRLRRLVVAPLALGAGERDLVSYSGGHFCFALVGKRTPRQGPGPTRTRKCSRPIEVRPGSAGP